MIRNIKILLCIALALAVFIYWFRYYPVIKFMKPYEKFVQQKITEKQLILKLGKPLEIISKQNDMEKFRPVNNRIYDIDSKVFIYNADPYKDGEGYLLLIYINHNKRVSDIVLAMNRF